MAKKLINTILSMWLELLVAIVVVGSIYLIIAFKMGLLLTIIAFKMGLLLTIIGIALAYLVGMLFSIGYLRRFYAKHQVPCPAIILWYGAIFWFIWLPQAVAFDLRMRHLDKKK